MSTSTPPELRVLCRKLTSIPPTQLVHALPSLVGHVIRCGDALSAPQEQKLKDNAPESSVLVHKLKTSITTLLNGRSREGRFVAVGLIKAAVDVGGWEILRNSKPWVTGLLSILQKSDPIPSKELAAVTLTRIYMLVQPYQTLTREIATPTIPAFITALLQLIKGAASSSESYVPESILETVCDSFSALIPLYSTTFRPSSSQIKTAVRPFLVPTSSDSRVIPLCLQRAARRVVISLHHVAAKSGGSEEWGKLVENLVKEFHATGDQVFRAVDESWEAPSAYRRSGIINHNEECHGGGSSPDEFPPWTGIGAGIERLEGLLDFLSDCLKYATKSAVVIPTNTLSSVINRVCLIARLSPKTQSWDQALQTNSAVGREEKDELWSAMPQIHVAAMHLISSMAERLGSEVLPLTAEWMDHLARVFKSGMSASLIRQAGYEVLKDLLSLAGPTMSKPVIDNIGTLIGACCRDLQQDAGMLKQTEKPAPSSSSTKKNGVAANADLFLQTQTSPVEESPRLEANHKAAADALLATLLSSLPQHQLKPTIRGLLDKTAILTRNRDAMVASVLNPYKDQRGRIYPSILPYLAQEYPEDPALEILRSNLRGVSANGDGSTATTLEKLEEEDGEVVNLLDADMDVDEDDEEQDAEPEAWKPAAAPAVPEQETALRIQKSVFEPQQTATTTAFKVTSSLKAADSPPKRKHDEGDEKSTKRQELEESKLPASKPAAVAPVAQPMAEDVDDDDDSDESVHLNMELEDDDDEEEEDD